MKTKKVDASKHKVLPEELLAMLTTGTEVVITRSGTPVVRLAPLPCDSTLRIAGLHAGAITVSDDFDSPHELTEADPTDQP